MKKLRTILSALATLRRTPSTAIASAWAKVLAAAVMDLNENSQTEIGEADIDLVSSLVEAVIAIAKDDEDKAAAPGKADKPAA